MNNETPLRTLCARTAFVGERSYYTRHARWQEVRPGCARAQAYIQQLATHNMNRAGTGRALESAQERRVQAQQYEWRCHTGMVRQTKVNSGTHEPPIQRARNRINNAAAPVITRISVFPENYGETMRVVRYPAGEKPPPCKWQTRAIWLDVYRCCCWYGSVFSSFPPQNHAMPKTNKPASTRVEKAKACEPKTSL